VAIQALLRISVADEWTLREFWTLLGLVEKSYFRMAILALPPLQKQLFEFSLESEESTELDEISPFAFAAISRTLFSNARAQVGELRLERIHIGSPGLFELAADATIAGVIVQICTLLRGSLGGRGSTERRGIAAIRDITLHGIDVSTRHPAAAEVIERMIQSAASELTHIAREGRVTRIEIPKHQ